MRDHRSIETVVMGRNAVDGAGVKLVRLFGHREAHEFDPFLLMEAFDNDRPEDYVKGFPWHPHRGIETITYLLDGHVEHGDILAQNVPCIADRGCEVRVIAGADGLRFILLSGPPLNEPIAAGGPIVMNTQDELDAAFRELELGTFIKHRI